MLERANPVLPQGPVVRRLLRVAALPCFHGLEGARRGIFPPCAQLSQCQVPGNPPAAPPARLLSVFGAQCRAVTDNDVGAPAREPGVHANSEATCSTHEVSFAVCAGRRGAQSLFKDRTVRA